MSSQFASPPEQLLGLRQVYDFVVRRFYVLAGTFILAMVAVGVVYKLVPRQFRADVVLVPIPDSTVDIGAAGVSGVPQLSALLGGAAGSSWRQESIAFLGSRQLSSATVESLKLVDQVLPNPDGSIGKVVQAEQAARKFQQTFLRVADDRMTGIVTVSVTWNDPDEAAKIANHFVGNANALAKRYALERLAATIKYLQAELNASSTTEVRAVLTALLERNFKALAVANTRPDFAYRVIDPAMSAGAASRVSPNLLSFIAFGGAISLILAILVGVYADFASRRRRSA